jgi:hypothetical protein
VRGKDTSHSQLGHSGGVEARDVMNYSPQRVLQQRPKISGLHGDLMEWPDVLLVVVAHPGIGGTVHRSGTQRDDSEVGRLALRVEGSRCAYYALPNMMKMHYS